jgi:hypothetical protein
MQTYSDKHPRAQSMPMAAPTAASTPAAGTLNDAKALFDLGVLVAELLAPLVPEPVLPAPVWDAEEDS